MRYKILFVCFFFCLLCYGQEKIYLKSGEIERTFDYELVNDDSIKYYFTVFNDIPNQKEIRELELNGIELLEYIPVNTYVVSLDKGVSRQLLNQYSIKSIFPVEPIHKLDPKIQNNSFPDWIVNTDGRISVKVLLYKNVDFSDVLNYFKANFNIDNINVHSNSITVTVDPLDLHDLSVINEVWYIEPIDAPSFPENKTARTLHRSNTINTNYASGKHYNGEGINIMMQDDGLVGPHIDRQGRVDQSFCNGCSSSSSNDHGDHVSGTIMGAGNLDPLGKGMADGAFLYVYGSSNNNYYDVPNLYLNYDVLITSKSYSDGCNAGYTSLARDLDEQINMYPSLIHVFSAGNNGSSDCGYGAGSGWGNVTGGHKQGKNVIATANLTETGGLASSSSRGPAEDGRIKPDIGAKGTDVYSPVSPYTYDSYTGTSMACPGVSGVMAQLYHAYKDLNNDEFPSSALMKCILLNSADDIGNPGPDFKHGWGEVNAYKALNILENNTYFSDSISQGDNNVHLITIPTGVKQVKIMTYWHDKEASANASISLVNNINSYITDPNGIVYNPWVLDESPNSSSLDQNAYRGIDDLNNMEQITFDDPISGTYILSLFGYSIAFGPEEYYVTYEFITEDIQLTYPVGGESLVPGELELIRWDATDGNIPFLIEYTVDNGVNWSTITSSASVSSNYYNWQVPNLVTDEARIRISRNGFASESNYNFTIIDVPNSFNVNWVCPDSIFVSWSAVNGATSYEISMLGQKYMDSVFTTSNVSAWIINPNPSITDGWFSVCAKINDSKGRRAIAVNAQPINNGCVAPPTASFIVLNSPSCTGEISFLDESLNQPNNWNWDFGDGTYSNNQNPTHLYLSEGVYDVSLFVSNGLGQDSILQTGVVMINFPAGPTTYNDTSYVTPASFILNSSSNTSDWYNDTLGSSSFFSGSTFSTPLLTSNTTYYVRDLVGGNSIFGGPLNNNIGGGSFYNNDRHLFIDCHVASKLLSADVYAGTNHDITFELRNNNSQVLEDTTIEVQIGLNTLYLDFDMPVMNDLELGISSGGSDLFSLNGF